MYLKHPASRAEREREREGEWGIELESLLPGPLAKARAS